jgi:hypothetical protein
MVLQKKQAAPALSQTRSSFIVPIFEIHLKQLHSAARHLDRGVFAA